MGERQHLKFIITFDQRMIVHSEPALNGFNAIEEDIPLIQSGSSYQRNFQVELGDLAQFFELVPFTVSIYLRGKKIENIQSSIRLTPNYFPTVPGEHNYDILLFTDKQIIREEFLGYIKIIEGLGLNVNIWDIERYGKLEKFLQIINFV